METFLELLLVVAMVTFGIYRRKKYKQGVADGKTFKHYGWKTAGMQFLIFMVFTIAIGLTTPDTGDDDDDTADSEPATHQVAKKKSKAAEQSSKEKAKEKKKLKEAREMAKERQELDRLAKERKEKAKKSKPKKDTTMSDMYKRDWKEFTQEVQSELPGKYQDIAIKDVSFVGKTEVDVTLKDSFVKQSTADELTVIGKSIVDDVSEMYKNHEPYRHGSSVATVLIFKEDQSAIGSGDTTGSYTPAN